MKRQLAILFFSAASLFAQPQTAEPSPESFTAAEELAKTMGIQEQMAAGFDAMLPSIQGMAQKMNLTEEGSKELQDIYRKWFDEDLDHESLHKSIVRLYAKTYTVQELVELNRFYQTDLGKKTLKVMPELMQQGAAAGMEEANNKQQLLADRLKPFFDKHGPKK